MLATAGFAVEPTRGYQTRVTLIGPTGKRVGRPSVQPVPAGYTVPYVFRGFTSAHSFTVPKVAAWSAESPSRYRVDVELLARRHGLEGYLGHASTFGIPLLAPWANRLALPGQSVAGVAWEVRPGDPSVHADEYGQPIHGLMAGAPEWETTDVGSSDGSAWLTARLAGLTALLADRFAPGGLVHHGQGKWYPGEPLPRWALTCYFRKDGTPIWRRSRHSLTSTPLGWPSSVRAVWITVATPWNRSWTRPGSGRCAAASPTPRTVTASPSWRGGRSAGRARTRRWAPSSFTPTGAPAS